MAKRSQQSWQITLSWPVLFGLLSGSFELLGYVGGVPLLAVVSSLSTLFLFFSGIWQGWRAGVISAVIAYVLSALAFFVRPGLFVSNMGLINQLILLFFELSLPVLLAFIVQNQLDRPTYNRAIGFLGLWGVFSLMPALISTEILYGVSQAVNNHVAVLVELIQAKKSSEGLTLERWLSLYQSLMRFTPGLYVADVLKTQLLQFILALYFFRYRNGKETPDQFFGALALDRYWGYLFLLCLLSILVLPGAFLKYFSLNAMQIILLLYLVNGFDIVYQRLRARQVSFVAVSLILFVCYVVGWPMIILLGIGLVDRVRSLRVRSPDRWRK